MWWHPMTGTDWTIQFSGVEMIEVKVTEFIDLSAHA